MVSPQENYPGRAAETAPPLGVGDRGIREPVVAPAQVPLTTAELAPPAYRYFWGSAVAGTLVALTFTVFSIALMFGIGVGRTGNIVNAGWGTGIWVIVTACLAYYLGGMCASRISADPGETGWLRGVGVWGLSLPLALSILSLVIIAGSMAYSATTPQVQLQASVPPNAAVFTDRIFYLSVGRAWTLFLSLGLGLLCAIGGGMSGRFAHMRTDRLIAEERR